ncbi:MAG: 30S ribosomal protein S3 [Erysipelotrichaceae bacterium]|nr:30S ribosomal protein S3 [Erysipelotrichaceae bacterium]
MGQKVSPIGMRTGINRDYESRWYSKKNFADFLIEDVKIREFLNKELKDAVLSKIEIERTAKNVTLNVYVARPGVVIGQDGKRVEELKKKINKITHKKDLKLNVLEVKNPDFDATLVAKAIAEQLENRASFRATQKKAVQKVMKAGAKGIKTLVSGRLGGAEIARSEGYSEGIVPLQTLRADIDYAAVEADTTYGKLGVKVWICREGKIPGAKKENKKEGE